MNGSMKKIALGNTLFFKLYNWLHSGKYWRVPIAALQSGAQQPVQILQSEQTCELVLPHFLGRDKPAPLCRSVPEIAITCLSNAVLTLDAANFYMDGRLLVETLPSVPMGVANYAGSMVRCNNTDTAMLRGIQDALFQPGKSLLLGGNGAGNYYHWLLEVLPKLGLLNQSTLDALGIEQILLGEQVQRIPSFQAALMAVLAARGITAPLVVLPYGQTVRVEHGFHITSPNAVLLNALDKAFPNSHGYFSRGMLAEYADIFRPLAKVVAFAPKKIFLMRKASSLSAYNKRHFNQDEVFAIFARYGFEAVVVEDYSFFEQIYLFSQASHIVGASGAFWANVIFCSPGCKAASWLVPEFEDFLVYSTLAHYFACEMYFVQAQAEQLGDMHGSYRLDSLRVEQFCQQLEQTNFFVN